MSDPDFALTSAGLASDAKDSLYGGTFRLTGRERQLRAGIDHPLHLAWRSALGRSLLLHLHSLREGRMLVMGSSRRFAVPGDGNSPSQLLTRALAPFLPVDLRQPLHCSFPRPDLVAPRSKIDRTPDVADSGNAQKDTLTAKQPKCIL